MTADNTVMVVAGTRPEAIKVAPVIQALAADDVLVPSYVVTGQHREMLDQVNDFFGIVPDVDLDLMSHGASVNAIARSVLEALEAHIERTRPAAIVVQGDTTSAFAASLAGFLEGVPVVHVEAGLRTGNVRSPFPEEANRRLTAVIADLHAAPTDLARRNLESENIDPASIIVTGNTVIDALMWAVQQPVVFTDPALQSLDESRPLLLVTSHRRESWGEPMRTAMTGVAEVARRHPELQVVLPMHRNPLVREVITATLSDLPNVTLTEPITYAEFAQLQNRATVILTDSGGIQEEAPSLGKPVLVMREETERLEGIAAGTARLVGTATESVRDEVERLLVDEAAYQEMAMAVNPYGDGLAASRTVAALRSVLLGEPMPEPFSTNPPLTMKVGERV